MSPEMHIARIQICAMHMILLSIVLLESGTQIVIDTFSPRIYDSLIT